LCEDDEHRRLAIAYLKHCRINTDRLVVEKVASRLQQGGNVGWVLSEFPRQLHACRQRHKRAKTLLVVMLDADQHTVEQRRRQLNERLKHEGHEDLDADDPVALLIPRRHVETWVCALLGQVVTEEDDCKGRCKMTKAEIRQAAQTAYEWARENATPGPTCVQSLRTAFPEWRKLG
jgi:hypothetical protein